MAPSTRGALFSLLPALALGKDLIVGPSVVEVTKGFNDVFPYENFNRNVSVPMWQTQLLKGNVNGNDKSEIKEDLTTIANASFIVYDPAFYKVRVP
jgi:hypothetical protein